VAATLISGGRLSSMSSSGMGEASVWPIKFPDVSVYRPEQASNYSARSQMVLSIRGKGGERVRVTITTKWLSRTPFVLVELVGSVDSHHEHYNLRQWPPRVRSINVGICTYRKLMILCYEWATVDPNEVKIIYLRATGGEVGASSALAPKIGPLGLVSKLRWV
jgi:hypothetical protein